METATSTKCAVDSISGTIRKVEARDEAATGEIKFLQAKFSNQPGDKGGGAGAAHQDLQCGPRARQ
eukprot:3364523-Pyramimonas_sp.AAC.1